MTIDYGRDHADPVDWQLDPHGEPAWSSWRPLDVGPVLDGMWQAPMPTVGACHTAPGLLYPGRRHDVYSPSEAGKTWLALRVVGDELTAGRAAVFVDFEDDIGGIVGRLSLMGVADDAIRARFAYIRPESPLWAPGEAEVVRQALGDLQPTVVVLDGRTEAMGLHGLKVIDNDDVARYGRVVERPFTEFGAAVLALDHVVKDGDQRGRYGIGGVHKLNGLNGASFNLDNRRPFGRGVIGRSTVRIGKDRPGQLRRHGLPGKDGSVWLADLVVDDTNHHFTDVSLMAPVEVRKAAAEFAPTEFMVKVSEALRKAGKPLSKSGIEERVTGKATTVRSALAHLVDEGFVAEEPGPRGALLHRLVKEFVPDE